MQSDDDIEISEAKVSSFKTSVPVGKRLRMAIEALPEGHDFVFRSSMERQHIYNIIAKIKKLTGKNFTTRRVQKADENGKTIVQIVRLPDSPDAKINASDSKQTE